MISGFFMKAKRHASPSADQPKDDQREYPFQNVENSFSIF